MLINLTNEERTKFAAWLRQEEQTEINMMEQAKKINLPAPILTHMARYALACSMIAHKLETTEVMTIK